MKSWTGGSLSGAEEKGCLDSRCRPGRKPARKPKRGRGGFSQFREAWQENSNLVEKVVGEKQLYLGPRRQLCALVQSSPSSSKSASMVGAGRGGGGQGPSHP